MNGYQETVRLTDHARQRCVEMGITTKVPKAIMRDQALVLPANPGPHGEPRLMIRGRVHTEYLLIVDVETWRVVTVLYWSPEVYIRREVG